jgi:hypothetical protein
VENDDHQEGARFGSTFAVPVTRHHSVKFYAITGYNAHRDHDFKGLRHRVAIPLGRY